MGSAQSVAVNASRFGADSGLGIKDFLPPIVEGGLGAIANVLGFTSAKDQMKSQKYATTHAHRIEMDDLRAAGINPLMTAGGSGAQAPAGVSYDPSNPAGGLSRYMVGKTLQKAQLEQLDAQTYATAQQGEATALDNMIKNEMAESMINSAKLKTIQENQVVKNLRAQGELLQYQLPSAKAESEWWTSGKPMDFESFLKSFLKHMFPGGIR